MYLAVNFPLYDDVVVMEGLGMFMHGLLEKIAHKKKKNKADVRFRWSFGLAEPKERTVMVEVTITNEQKITATLTPVTETGKPAKLDGAPVWTVQSGDSTLNVATDGLSAELISSDNPGDTQFLIEADADLGAGVVTISDVIKLTVAGAQAKNLGLSLGVAQPK